MDVEVRVAHLTRSGSFILSSRLAAIMCAAVGLHCCFAMVSAGLSAMAADPEEEQPSADRFSESFDDPRLLERGWYDGSKFTISDGQPYAGKGCIEYAWKAGTTTPASSSGIRRLFEATDTVYLRCYIRLSKGWGWTGRPYHPHLMHFMTTENEKFRGPAASHLTVYIEPWNGHLRLAAQDIQNKDAPHGLTQGPLRGGYNGRFYDSEEAVFNDDGWHCVEAMFRLNSLDLKADRPNADGVVRGWFDGELVIDRTDVVLRSTDFPKMKFNQFLLLPYFGSGLLPHQQTLWIDELAVGTERLGPFEAAASDAIGPRQSRRRQTDSNSNRALTRFREAGGVPEWVNENEQHLMIRRFNVKERRISLSKLEVMPDVKILTLHGYDFGDEDLQVLAEWKHLEGLQFIYNEGVTDEGMKHVEGMRELRRLVLWQTKVTSSGIKRLAPLANLEYLEIQHSPVGDAGLEALESSKKLAVVILLGTNVTRSSADRLARALPDCTVDWHEY